MLVNTSVKLLNKKSESVLSKDGKKYEKRIVLVDTGGDFPKTLALETLSEKVAKDIDSVGIGENVRVSFIISSREYNGKFYTQLSLLEISSLLYETQEPQEEPQDDGDDLPF